MDKKLNIDPKERVINAIIEQQEINRQEIELSEEATVAIQEISKDKITTSDESIKEDESTTSAKSAKETIEKASAESPEFTKCYNIDDNGNVLVIKQLDEKQVEIRVFSSTFDNGIVKKAKEIALNLSGEIQLEEDTSKLYFTLPLAKLVAFCAPLIDNSFYNYYCE